MEVRLGSYGNVVIGHKTKIGKLADIFAIGNDIRRAHNLEPKDVLRFLRKQSTWEYIAELSIILDDKNSLKSDSSKSVDSTELDVIEKYDFSEYKDSSGQIIYKDLIKQFPLVIQSKRGKYGGTWCHLELLVKAAMYLHAKLEAEVIHTFVEGNILQHRDDGGEQFKLLNAQIDTLTDRLPDAKPKGNKGVYIQISKLVRTKLEIVDSFGYNEDDHTAAVQNNRDEMLKTATNLIKMGMITTYPQLKAFILNYPITK